VFIRVNSWLKKIAKTEKYLKVHNMIETQSKWDRLIFRGIVALLIFSPLAFGSVHVWAYCLMEVAVFSLLILFFTDRLLLSKSPALTWVRTPVNLWLILLLLLIGFQMLPLPSSWIAFVSPRTFADKRLLSEMISPSHAPGWMCLTYYRHASLMEFLKMAAYAGMFFLVLNTVRTKQQTRVLMYVLIGLGIFEAMYALAQIFSETPRVWWWKSRAGTGGFASGTFIGSNHFAFYMEMMLGLSFGLVIAHRGRQKRLTPGLSGFRVLVQRVVAWFSPESDQTRQILFSFVTILMGVAILLSASRGGILSAGMAIFLVSILLFTKSRCRGFGVLALGLCLVALIWGSRMGIQPAVEKFSHTEGLGQRLSITQTLLSMISDYPLLGVGWGNFRYLYPRYMTKEGEGVFFSGYSHNDWAEAGAEAGLAGMLFIIAVFAAYLITMIRIWQKRRSPYALGIGAGVMIGMISIGIHSFFDFSMHIPANPLTLSVLMATGYLVLHRTGTAYQESFFYQVRTLPLTLWPRIGLMCLCLFILGGGIFGVVRHFRAEVHCPTEWNSTMNLNWNPYLTDIEKAIAHNPGNAEYHARLAEYYMGKQISDKTLRERYNEKATESLKTAIHLNPGQGTYWYELGENCASKRYAPYPYLNQWLPLADHCFEISIRCAPNDVNIISKVAKYWVRRSTMLPETKDMLSGDASFSREQGIQKFQRLFQHALRIRPNLWEWAVIQVWEYYPDADILTEIVPPRDGEMEGLVLQWLENKMN